MLPRPERHALSKGSNDVRGPHVCLRGSDYRSDNANVQEHAFVVIFGSPLFCTRDHCEDLRMVIVTVVIALEDDFFLKTVPDIGHP